MAAAAAPNVKLLFGPMLIGTYLNTILFGILLIQVFIYYRTYRKDAPWLRYFILFLFIAETLNTGFDIAMMYEPLILNYATPEATTFFPHFLAADPFMTVIISTPIQIFIAWRIKIISRSWWISTIICVLSLISFGGGIWLTHTVTVVRRFAKKPELHWPALTWLLASAIADVIITISLTVSLSRRKTGFSSTDDTINKIIRLTVQTGLITAIFAILDVVCFLVLPHAAINFVWDFALSKLYSNALMSTLNARAGWENLANGHNLLFGSDGSGRRTLETFVSTNFRAPPVSDFELSSHPRSRSKGDIEFGMGISMTSKGDETITTQEPELGFGPPNAGSLTQ